MDVEPKIDTQRCCWWWRWRRQRRWWYDATNHFYCYDYFRLLRPPPSFPPMMYAHSSIVCGILWLVCVCFFGWANATNERASERMNEKRNRSHWFQKPILSNRLSYKVFRFCVHHFIYIFSLCNAFISNNKIQAFYYLLLLWNYGRNVFDFIVLWLVSVCEREFYFLFLHQPIFDCYVLSFGRTSRSRTRKTQTNHERKEEIC